MYQQAKMVCRVSQRLIQFCITITIGSENKIKSYLTYLDLAMLSPILELKALVNSCAAQQTEDLSSIKQLPHKALLSGILSFFHNISGHMSLQ